MKPFKEDVNAMESDLSDRCDIICGDCLNAMGVMGDGEVDLVFCSPPYEDRRTYGIGFVKSGDAWVEWAIDRYMECLRVCRGLVAWVVEGKTAGFRWSAVPVLLAAEIHRRGGFLRKPPAFCRVGIPGSGGPDWLRNDYELIVCATGRPGRLAWSDATAMGHPPKWAPGGEMSHRLSNGQRRNQWGASYGSSVEVDKDKGAISKKIVRPSHVLHTKRTEAGPMESQSYAPPVKANPGNLIRCTVGGGHMGSKLAHENEAPFPEALAEFFIRSFCRPGGTVLDPFSGSGTTAAVALNLGRRAIAMDVRASQCELTRRRIMEGNA